MKNVTFEKIGKSLSKSEMNFVKGGTTYVKGDTLSDCSTYWNGAFTNANTDNWVTGGHSEKPSVK